MEQVTRIDARLIVPGNNDRTQFDPAALRDLANSIQNQGLIQPITVRPIDDTELYQIVAGERRYRATQLLGWPEVPALVVDLSDEEAAAVMLAENVSRKDLDPIDEARAYQVRISRFGWDEARCAQEAGVSKTRVQFSLKLLRLRDDVQDLIRKGQLQRGYAQILADTNLDPNFQMLAVRKLRDNAHPTPPWFRRICSELLSQQAQGVLFDAPLFGGQLPIDASASQAEPEPPHPSTTVPPRQGRTTKEVIANQAGFWQQAAESWNRLGKPFKRQECEAAARALQSTMMIL